MSTKWLSAPWNRLGDSRLSGMTPRRVHAQFCGGPGVEKYHYILLTRELANCGQLQVNKDTLRQIVNVLRTCNTPT